MKIDCHDCSMYRTEHCDDCLVTFLLHPPEGAVEIDEGLQEPLEALSGAGLIPVLKFRRREDAGDASELADRATEAG